MEPRHHTLRYLLNRVFYRLAWVEFGPPDAPPLVCVHGLTRNGRDFDPLAIALADRFRVISPDLPGRGASEWLPEASLYTPVAYVQALAHLLAAAGEAVTYVGTSLGGICGMMIAAAPGQPITRMVLNDVGGFIPAASIGRIAANMAGAPAEFADLDALEARLRVVAAPFGKLTDAQWRHLATHSARTLPNGRLTMHYDPKIAEAFDRADAPADVVLWPIWERVRIPTLVVRGVDSDLLEPETLARMEHDGAKALLVADAGHAPALMDAPTIAAVRAFLLG